MGGTRFLGPILGKILSWQRRTHFGSIGVAMKEPLDVAMDTAGIARVTINRPKRANAIDPELAASLFEALEWLANEPKLRVLVLLGNGRTFCAGLDLKAM